ncbi:MAG TPA: hypothetical protein VG269_16250 [Tepidisphaeraceae bacterium]|nr:hypothetical protein [Tepidisphaeraceae bacterium]
MSSSSLAAAGPATKPTDPDVELDFVLADLRLGQVSFGQAVNALRDRSGANLFVNWARLAQAGITPDLKVELSLHDVTLRQAVVKLVESVHVADAASAWGVRDGIITVSTPEDLGPEPLVTRFYAVEDILDASVVRAFPPKLRPADTPVDLAGREKLLVSIVVGALWTERSPLTPERQGPEAWVQVWSGRLVVTAPRDNHRVVRELLRQFREAH